ncbi:MAG: class I SAM-dependent methyltransferase [Dehalococcoidales bacterium]|nr:MAG: class I SAM-dependent methyltransferase [Dehalococcoidales bacterium]
MDKSEQFWDKQAKNFADQEQHTQLSENKDFITTLKYLDIDDTVLDYGCATGIVSNAIADKVKEIHAIDISSKMIELAKSKASERHIDNIHYAHATIFDKRYQKESFDVILAFRILHMLEDIQAVMRRINELLKSGGIFISVSACMGDKKTLLGILVFLASKMRIVPQHINLFKLPELQGIITGGGFQIVEYERMDDRVPHFCIVARKI